MKTPRGNTRSAVEANKIIPFPSADVSDCEDNYPDLIRCLLQQHFPTDTWKRLRTDLTTQCRAKVFLHRILKHLDYAKRLQFVMMALSHLGYGVARDLGFQLVFKDPKRSRRAQ